MELYLWWDTADVGKQILKEFSVKGRPYSLTQKSDVCLSLILGSLVGDYNKSEEKSEKKKAILSLLSLNGCQESAFLVYSASLCLHLVLFSCTFLCEALWAKSCYWYCTTEVQCIHSHTTLDTAQPCHLLKPNWKPPSSQYFQYPVSATVSVSVYVCVCICVFVVPI